MPPDSLVLNSNIVQGGTNAKPDNVIQAFIHKIKNEIVYQVLQSPEGVPFCFLEVRGRRSGPAECRASF